MSAIPQSARVPVEEYLATSYRPDCDYVDGEIEERNLGEKEHSILQQALVFLFRLNRDTWHVEVFPELRVQVKPTRYRVPDVTVIQTGVSWERILRKPALLFVEILSPEDRLSKVRRGSMTISTSAPSTFGSSIPSYAKDMSVHGVVFRNLKVASSKFQVHRFAWCSASCSRSWIGLSR